MALIRFDGGSLSGRLVAYYNISEIGKEPTTTGTDVDTIPPGYDGVGPDAFPYFRGGDWTGRVQYDSGNPAMIGAMKATTHPASSGMSSTHTQRAYPDGLTTICISRGSGYAESHGVNDGSTNMFAVWTGNSSPQNYTHSIGSTQVKSTIPYPENVYGICITVVHPPDESGGTFSTYDVHVRDETPTDLSWSATRRSIHRASTDYYFGCSGRDFSSSLGGDLALFAVYDKAITSGELSDLLELCTYWVNEGAAPSQGELPPSTKFHVSTNDLGATLSWKVLRSGFDWADWDAPVENGGLSNARMLNENGQENDTLEIVTAVVADSCSIKCVASTDYNDGKDSKIDQLVVVPAGGS